jgi:hypothetical protein
MVTLKKAGDGKSCVAVSMASCVSFHQIDMIEKLPRGYLDIHITT